MKLSIKQSQLKKIIRQAIQSSQPPLMSVLQKTQTEHRMYGERWKYIDDRRRYRLLYVAKNQPNHYQERQAIKYWLIKRNIFDKYMQVSHDPLQKHMMAQVKINNEVVSSIIFQQGLVQTLAPFKGYYKRNWPKKEDRWAKTFLTKKGAERLKSHGLIKNINIVPTEDIPIRPPPLSSFTKGSGSPFPGGRPRGKSKNQSLAEARLRQVTWRRPGSLRSGTRRSKLQYGRYQHFLLLYLLASPGRTWLQLIYALILWQQPDFNDHKRHALRSSAGTQAQMTLSQFVGPDGDLIKQGLVSTVIIQHQGVPVSSESNGFMLTQQGRQFIKIVGILKFKDEVASYAKKRKQLAAKNSRRREGWMTHDQLNQAPEKDKKPKETKPSQKQLFDFDLDDDDFSDLFWNL